MVVVLLLSLLPSAHLAPIPLLKSCYIYEGNVFLGPVVNPGAQRPQLKREVLMHLLRFVHVQLSRFRFAVERMVSLLYGDILD